MRPSSLFWSYVLDDFEEKQFLCFDRAMDVSTLNRSGRVLKLLVIANAGGACKVIERRKQIVASKAVGDMPLPRSETSLRGDHQRLSVVAPLKRN